MLLSVPKNLLAEHLQIVSKAVPLRSTIQAVEGILFESNGESMTLTANNLEMGIQTTFPAAHEKTGRVVLPAKVVEIVRRLPGDSVQMVVHPEHYLTEIKSGQTEFQLYGLNADEFPMFPDFSAKKAEYRFKIKASHFRRALRQTLFAVSHDEGKPAFTGVLLSVNEDTAVFSSSDTFRLATTNCPLENEGKNGAFLVPARNLHEAVRIFTEEEEELEGCVLQNQLILKSNGKQFSSRLLDENFPNVERVIPREFIGKAYVEMTEFQQAVERAALLSEGSNHTVRLSVGKDVMVIRASSKYGKIQEKIPLRLEGDGLEMSLNSRFILDMLKTSEGEECILEMVGPNKPCILKDSLCESYLYLVLPIKI